MLYLPRLEEADRPEGWPFRSGGMPTRQEILKYYVFNGAVWGHLGHLASFHRKMTLFLYNCLFIDVTYAGGGDRGVS